MEYTKQLFTILIFSILTTSCYSQKYYKKIIRNIDDFTNAIQYINQQGSFLSKDTLKLKDGTVINHNSNCIYVEDVKDSILKKFMLDYHLKRICFTKANNSFFDSVITFHKQYSPLTGKAVIITYDFGRSSLRDTIMKGGKLKDEEIKIINALYLYRVKNKPSFGE
jgi:hypothetical protein